MLQNVPIKATMTGASHGPDGGLVLYTNASRPKCMRPIALVNICMWYQDGSLRWYAANILTIPTANVYVPNVLDERGVVGEVAGAELLGLLWPGYRRRV